jgi:hypothetical protein
MFALGARGAVSGHYLHFSSEVRGNAERPAQRHTMVWCTRYFESFFLVDQASPDASERRRKRCSPISVCSPAAKLQSSCCRRKRVEKYSDLRSLCRRGLFSHVQIKMCMFINTKSLHHLRNAQNGLWLYMYGTMMTIAGRNQGEQFHPQNDQEIHALLAGTQGKRKRKGGLGLILQE